MYTRIEVLRRGGRKITYDEQSRPEPEMVGCLEIAGGRCVLWRTSSRVWPPVATLHGAQVLSVIAGELLVRGYEEWNGRGVMQEWRCRFMSGPEFSSLTSR